ncbi:MAG TPA: hypothetical protein VD813_02885 [Pseudonocardia sp.]|nr:hypothetical protein [Pseudonocardia sp.]
MSAYTLVIGDENGPPVISVHGTAEEAWRALHREVRARSRAWWPSWRRVRPETARRLAAAWRDADRERRFWQIRTHQVSVMVPVSGRARADQQPDPSPAP